MNLLVELVDAPAELQDGIREFWPPEEWVVGANISYLESGWNAFAVANTVSSDHPCGTVLHVVDGISVTAELSVGYFQINSCNFPGWEWQRLYNARHNCGTAHLLWLNAGGLWTPWYYSSKILGLGYSPAQYLVGSQIRWRALS